jgi:serine phosphatase RsbU (regulator of sigma subunit)
VLLYTDGLIEHDRTDLDEGIARLAAAAADLAELPVDQFCDQLLARLLPDHADDDVALLALRCHPQHATTRAARRNAGCDVSNDASGCG